MLSMLVQWWMSKFGPIYVLHCCELYPLKQPFREKAKVSFNPRAETIKHILNSPFMFMIAHIYPPHFILTRKGEGRWQIWCRFGFSFHDPEDYLSVAHATTGIQKSQWNSHKWAATKKRFVFKNTSTDTWNCFSSTLNFNFTPNMSPLFFFRLYSFVQ